MPADSMSGMMHDPAGEMMRGMPMSAESRPLGPERPLLSLALRHRTELGLSDDQTTTLQALVGRFGKEAQERLREIEAAERDLAGLLQQEPADFAQVESKVRAIEKLRADLRLRRIQTLAEGRAVLTPEQRAKLDLPAAERSRSGQRHSTRGAEEMHRFMRSERMPRAISAMMAMAERMGGGDTMLGMVRMMEMMSMMGGGMMGDEGTTGRGMTGDPIRPGSPRREKE
jgi:Spy/CpxP family protein refolding chaperone